MRFIALIAGLMINTLVFAIGFDLSVSETNIEQHETIQATFTLEDCKAKQEPDFTLLNKDFNIVEKFTQNRVSIVNGKVSKIKQWTFILSPKSYGSITIPSLEINTNRGVMHSDSVKLTVNQTASGYNSRSSNQSFNNNQAFIEANLETKEMYANQAILLSIDVYDAVGMSSLQIDNIDIDGFILDDQNKYDSFNKYINGRNVKVHKRNYILTPLHEGNFEIPSIKAVYEIAGNIFSRPTVIYSKPISLKVKPVKDNLVPFSKLAIVEEYDNTSDVINDNDSITRKVTIKGTEGFVDLLPSIKIKDSEHYKVYLDKPVLESTIGSDNKISTTKSYYFTFVPIKSGKVTLPAINLEYFNLKSKNKSKVKLPSKDITISIQETTAMSDTIDVSDATIVNESILKEDNILNNKNSLNNYIIVGLILSIVANITQSYFLYKRKTRKDDKIKLVNLSHIDTIESLHKHIKDYSKVKWGITNNSNLESIFLEMTNKGYKFDEVLAFKIRKAVNNNLYYKLNDELQESLDLWVLFLKTVNKVNDKIRNKNIEESSFNPT